MLEKDNNIEKIELAEVKNSFNKIKEYCAKQEHCNECKIYITCNECFGQIGGYIGPRNWDIYDKDFEF